MKDLILILFASDSGVVANEINSFSGKGSAFDLRQRIRNVDAPDGVRSGKGRALNFLKSL